MSQLTGMPSLESLNPNDLIGKTIFIRVDFNVPVEASNYTYYRVADDTRIRRFLDLTFKKIHDMTGGNCRIIIGSHLGRPHKEKDHSQWDGMYNMQFVCNHFDTLIRKIYNDNYIIFPPEIIGSHLKHSLEICAENRLPLGAIKFLPNLRYLLDPENPDSYRKEFIEGLADVADVFINCAFGSCHRLTKSVKLLPQIMRQKGKIAVAGVLLDEEIRRLGEFGKKVLDHPERTAVVAGGAKIADKIGILKEFVQAGIRRIFIGGKMVNTFLIARQFGEKSLKLNVAELPAKILEKTDEKNKQLLEEIRLAHEILTLAKVRNVEIVFPLDYKVASEYKATNFETKSMPDLSRELQLDLGPETIENYSKTILEGIDYFFWNGPLGAYDHPTCPHYAKASMELAQLLFVHALAHPNVSVVIGGGDSAAILNKFVTGEIKKLVREQLSLQLPATINKAMLNIDFIDSDSYNLFNYLADNFFVSTGGGASLEFLENFLKDKAKSPFATYLPGTATLMELYTEVKFESGRRSEVSPV
jgi:phosphoglycerate kinase